MPNNSNPPLRGLALSLLTAFACLAAPDPVAKGTGRGYRMDYGPVLGYTINCRRFGDDRPDDRVLKGLAVRLGSSNPVAVCFDTDLLRCAAGWTGRFLDISRTHLDSTKGSHEAFLDGDILFATPPKPGWSADGSFTDRPSLRYKGYFRHGRRIVFNYEVGGVEIWDMPGFERDGDQIRWLRHIRVSGPRPALHLSMGRSTVTIPAGDQSEIFRAEWDATAERGAVAKTDTGDPRALCGGGPGTWPGVVQTRGRLGTGGPYVVDTLALPEQNPWAAWMRLVALDFFSDGRAAVSTWNGDVWIVSGVDDTLERLEWKRFASGLFEPLGLRILNDGVFVLCRDQLARLHDLNSDGEADWVESFNRDAPVGPSYHAFAFELQTDRAGNFYYVRCGQRVDPALPLQGGLVKVSSDGKKSELIATGLRAANGLCVGPNDEITCADNQGNWIPASRINWIAPGGFYGYMPHARREPLPKESDPPLCWLPVQIDNSSGSQVWVIGDRWGPLAGKLLHTSYGKAALFLVMHEEVNGVAQGGAVQFPLKFDSGIMRARFSPRDGQLYVAGLRGWQTVGTRDGCLQRVRYTGGPLLLPVGLGVTADTISISFATELDPTSANDPENYAVESWNYLWTENYGSPEYKISDPSRQGRDQLNVTAAHLSPDARTVTLRIPDLRPAMQMRVQFRLRAKNGAPISHEIYSTINALPRTAAR